MSKKDELYQEKHYKELVSACGIVASMVVATIIDCDVPLDLLAELMGEGDLRRTICKEILKVIHKAQATETSLKTNSNLN